MINLNLVGANIDAANPNLLHLGIYLPNITKEKGYRLFADIIHLEDQFDPEIPAFAVELFNDTTDARLWRFSGDISTLAGPGSFGQAGKHLYRYRLERNGQLLVRAFADPFAKHSGLGTFSAFYYLQNQTHTWTDQDFKVPLINDLVIYEMMVDDFSDDFDGAIERITYLKSLGVNCIELMPVTNVPEPYRWGYMPMNYFAIEERYGGRAALMQFIDACHQNGIAVIHDAVYAHAHPEFCYNKVYGAVGEENPMIGGFAGEMFGVGTDFNKDFTFDYFMAVNDYFIEELHFDGFRYDYVPGIYDGATGKGYARIVYETYQRTKSNPRFDSPSHNRIIQIAEYLDDPKEIMEVTYTTGSKRWDAMKEAQNMVRSYGQVSEKYIKDLLLIDFQRPWPQTYSNSGDSFPVAAVQFIESHDQSRLMYIQSGEHSSYHGGFDILERNRSEWYKMQPFAISLMTCEGVPLLWQGQEFGEIYGKHDEGGSRVLAARPLHWSYFYEESGRTLVNLYRKLGQLRASLPALRSRYSYYFYQESNLGQGLVAYLRKTEEAVTTGSVLVVLNFNIYEQLIWLPLSTGRWEEVLNDTTEVLSSEPSQFVEIRVPSNYGKIYVLR